MSTKIDLLELKRNFDTHIFNNEDDIKINFYSEIITPILREVNPLFANQYSSENRLISGGRTDATFQNISFEFKKYNYFQTSKGIEEAIYGRKNSKDHGLYDYIVIDSGITNTDSDKVIIEKLTNNIGVGFDGKTFLFCRFIKSSKKHTVNTSIKNLPELNIEFIYEKKDFEVGLKKLTLLLKQQNKIALNKKNLVSLINTKSPFVRKTIQSIYNELKSSIEDIDNVNPRVRTLYKEWDRVFGIMYGEEEHATEFNEVSSVLKESYGLEYNMNLDIKLYLFAMQTFFNIFLKLLIHSFLSQLISPIFSTKTAFDKAGISLLFDGNDDENKLIDNFFETHFLEWFTFSDSEFEVDIINNTLENISKFDLSTYVLKPEEVQDILQEVYMELIPPEMRHLMGEYFSPDWIVEHSLDMVSYDGNIDKTLIDPTCGSATFLTQALKRIIAKKNGKLNYSDIKKITHNLVGFDINPISVVSAKANFILIMFSAFFEDIGKDYDEPISIPIYIADSILSPVVYTEENEHTLTIQTTVGEFEIPKFNSYKDASLFLKHLSNAIHEKPNYKRFWNKVFTNLSLVKKEDEEIVSNLFNQLFNLHRSGKNSFWLIILRNSFAPVMIGGKFDYVVGNPPWIAWKSMSKSYREGTLEVWQSYGIFEKNAYDKKTTHDDFGMAVTYVAVDQYLKIGGDMVFLLPASFLKSTKGGEGFRKLSIIRKEQNIPFSIDRVDDFSNVSLFTIPTIAIKFSKGHKMTYPLSNYKMWFQNGRKSKIDSHEKWNDVIKNLSENDMFAQPVDKTNIQSAWLTLPDMEFANMVLDSSKKRYYKGRKGIEPAGAKGVYILKHPTKCKNGLLCIENDISRQRRRDILEKGVHKGKIESDFIYPMLGGRNIERWRVKSNEFMLVPHTQEYKYGIPEEELELLAPKTIEWLDYFQVELLASRIQNGKFYNPDTQPYYRLDNVGEYTYSPYKVLWKEQTGSMSAVTVSTYYKTIPNADINLFDEDKPIVVDSKVLMLALDNEEEAYYVSGILNATNIREVIDGYAISTNRGVDVLKYIAIPKYDEKNDLHLSISTISKDIHKLMLKNNSNINEEEKNLEETVHKLFV